MASTTCSLKWLDELQHEILVSWSSISLCKTLWPNTNAIKIWYSKLCYVKHSKLYVQFIYEADLSKFSSISVLSQAELGMQIKTQLNWDQNCIFAELNELDVKSAMFDIAEFWVSDFESISLYI